jgi:hypothetical protein
MQGVAGKLISDDQFFRLSVRDTNGNEGIAEQILPGTRSLFFRGVLSGRVSELTFSGKSRYGPTVHALRLVYFVTVDLPANAGSEVQTKHDGRVRSTAHAIDLAKCKTPFGEFLMRTESGRLIVQCDSSKPMSRLLADRISEALSFVFARRMSWNVLELHSGEVKTLCIRGGQRTDTHHAPMPLDVSMGKEANDVWKMFSLYLTFACGALNNDYHPLSSHLFSIHESWIGTCEAKATSLGIAVEGITKLLPEHAKQQSQTETMASEFKKHCMAWREFGKPENERFRARTDGLLAQLSQAQPKGTLLSLAEQGVVETEHVQNWSKLRNVAAHANALGGAGFQELIDRCHATVVLVHHLVFHLIGYKGAFTDYSKYSYPVGRFGQEPSEDCTA